MKFLVTGGAGYIGSHMVKFLQNKRFKVDVIDNFSTGNKWAVSNCSVYDIDLLNYDALNNILSQNNYNAVFHFAAKSVVNDSFLNEQEYYDNNVIASTNLIDAMLKHNMKNIIFSSSASVFGEVKSTKINESHPKIPVNPYGKTKLIFEQILSETSNKLNLNAVILRYFNVAGADKSGKIGELHAPETHLIPTIFNNFTNERNILSIYGNDHNTKDGTCVRDYIHVNDIINAHYLAFKKLKNESGCFDFNLGNGNGFSVLEIIRACEFVTKKKVNYKFVNKREGEPGHLVADSSKANSELSWVTSYKDIKDIIKSAWNWHSTL